MLDRWVGDLILNTRAQIECAPDLESRSPGRPRPGRADERARPNTSNAQAAERRQNAAHRASGGSAKQNDQAPEGRKSNTEETVTLDDIRSCPQRLVSLSPAIETERHQTKEFLYHNLYFSPTLEPEKDDAERVITELFDLWMKHPEKLPASYQEKAEAEPLARIVCDYIAGMTDTYIFEQYEKHCGHDNASAE